MKDAFSHLWPLLEGITYESNASDAGEHEAPLPVFDSTW